MKWAQKVKIIKRANGQGGKYPLPEGKPDTWNLFGKTKRWNTATGKYDLPV